MIVPTSRGLLHLLRLGAVGAAVLAGSCAHQVSPSGGPVDKNPPKVLSGSLAQGQVRCPRSGDISFRFSEWIDPVSAAKCVTIFPPLDRGVRVTARGTEMRIRPLSALEDSTTYHLELNATLKDLHGNSIGTPYHLVFSTGEKLDSGTVRGCIADPLAAAGQPKVGLYRCVGDSAPDSLLLGIPSYLVQTDSAGGFVLRNVRPGAYEIAAFADRNNDNRLQPGDGETFASSQRRITVSSRDQHLELYPATCDTAVRRIRSVIAASPTVVIAQWSKAPETGTAADQTAWRVETVDAAQQAVDRVVVLPGSGRCAVLLKTDLRRTGYRLICPALRPSRAGFVEAGSDTLRFNGVTAPDTIRPKIVIRRPAGETDLQPRIAIGFSEPVRLVGGPWMLRDTLGVDSLAVVGDTAWTDTVLFSLERRLLPGAVYRLSLPLAAIEDLAGNHPAPADSSDSLAVTFTTARVDDICMSLAGSAACTALVAADPRRWLFTPFAGDRRHLCDDRAGSFRFDSIPAAKGRLTLFADANGDGTPSPGTLFPWRAPEPSVLFADTVEARARWDVAGVELAGCDPCARIVKKPAAGTRPGEPTRKPARDRSFERPTLPIGQ